MSAIEVLKRIKSKLRVSSNNISNFAYEERRRALIEETKEEYKILDDLLLALEKQENGLKCIGCGSIPKLKLCCNSCYQRLKLKEKRQVELIEWLEKEIRKCYPKNFCFKDWTPIMDTFQKQVRHDTLKEVLEMVGEQK